MPCAAYQLRAESHADPGLGFPGWLGGWGGWVCADGFIFRVLKCQSNVCQKMSVGVVSMLSPWESLLMKKTKFNEPIPPPPPPPTNYHPCRMDDKWT